ncbi:hypothetical protein MMC13_003851 [Lambiella insularis]|nr:hypothetical protein [Lambiella insularis]
MTGLNRPPVPVPKHYVFRDDGSMTPLIAVDELPECIRLRYVPRKLSPALSQGLQSLGVEPKSDLAYELEPGTFAAAAAAAEKSDSELTERAGGSVLEAVLEHPEEGHAAAGSSNAKPEEHPVEGWRRRVGTAAAKADLATAKAATATAKENSTASTFHNASKRSFLSSIATESQPYTPAQPGIFGVKEYCTHWIRKGECDFMQQGCIFKHVMPDLAGLQLLGYRSYPRWFREARGMTDENRELFGREPAPSPLPLPIPQSIPPPLQQPIPLPVPRTLSVPSTAPTHPASSPFDNLRNGHQAPLYGPGGPRSVFTNSSVGGGRFRTDGNNRFRGGPGRRPRHHQGSWNDQRQTAQSSPLRNGQSSNSIAPAPRSGDLVSPSGPSVVANNPSGPPPMRIEGLVEKFSNRATPQQVSTPPKAGLMQSIHNPVAPSVQESLPSESENVESFASTRSPSSAGSPLLSKIDPAPMSQAPPPTPAVEHHTPPTKSYTTKAMRSFMPLVPTPPPPFRAQAPATPIVPHAQVAPATRDLYDGIPKVPEPVVTRRFVSTDPQAPYVAPDATVKPESAEVEEQDQTEPRRTVQTVTQILQREKKTEQGAGEDEKAAAVITSPKASVKKPTSARRPTIQDVRLEDPATQLEAAFNRRSTWAANNKPSSSRRTNSKVFRRVKNGSEYLLDLDAE